MKLTAHPTRKLIEMTKGHKTRAKCSSSKAFRRCASFDLLSDDILAVILSFLDASFVLNTISFVSLRWTRDVLPAVWEEVEGGIPLNFIEKFSKEWSYCDTLSVRYWKKLHMQWQRQSLQYILEEFPNNVEKLPKFSRPWFITWRLYIKQETISVGKNFVLHAVAHDSNSTQDTFLLTLSPNVQEKLIQFESKEYMHNIDPTSVIRMRLFEVLPWNDPAKYESFVQLLEKKKVPLLIPNLVEVTGIFYLNDDHVLRIHAEQLQFIEQIEDNRVINLYKADPKFMIAVNEDKTKTPVPMIARYVGSTIIGEGIIGPKYSSRRKPIPLLVNMASNNLTLVLHCCDSRMRNQLEPIAAGMNGIEQVPFSGFSKIRFCGRIINSNLDVAVDKVDLIEVGVHWPNIIMCLLFVCVFGYLMYQGWLLAEEYSELLIRLRPESGNMLKRTLLWLRLGVSVPLVVIPAFPAILGFSGLCGELSSVIWQVKYRFQRSLCKI